MRSKNLTILLEYKEEDCVGSLLGKSVYPIMVLPSTSTTSPFLVYSQLPPVSAAKSTTTEPLFMESTISLVISLGASFPGIKAVVIIMSTSLAYLANSFISASIYSLDIVLA